MPGSTDDPGAGADTPAPSRLAGTDPFARDTPPIFALHLRPHRSLPRAGIAWVLGGTAAALSLPLIALGGGPVAWGLLPFMLLALAGLYAGLARSFHDGRLREDLALWPDLITVVRQEADGTIRRWHANPHWLRVTLYPRAKVENYLTLRGNGREIELGAFLSADEREALKREIDGALARLGP